MSCKRGLRIDPFDNTGIVLEDAAACDSVDFGDFTIEAL